MPISRASSVTSSHYFESVSTSKNYQKSRPRTAVSTIGGRDQQIFCAITESRGISPTVGLAFVNLSTAEVVLSQIADSQTYIRTLHKLHVFEPSEILIPSTAVGTTTSKLLQIIQCNLQFDAPIRPISRKYWDEVYGSESIQNLAFKEDVEAIKVSVGGNYFAVTCLAACLKFIEHELGIYFAANSIRMRYEPSEGSMLIDIATIHSLELIQNLRDAKSKECLFGLLNQTLTPMGARLLRCNILQPPTHQDVLEMRHAAVEELVSDEGQFMSVRQALKAFLDIDRVLTEIVVIPIRPSLQRWEQSINHVILLRQYVRAIPILYQSLENFGSQLLQRIREVCSPLSFTAVSELIDATVNDDITYQKKPVDLRHQRTYAVRSGRNGLLDIARQSYKEANDDAVELAAQLSEAHGFGRLDIKYDTSRQFYLTLPTAELERRDLPAVFINAVRRKNHIECQTLDLLKLNQKITDSHNEVLQMSDEIIRNLITEIRNHIGPLVRISESVATIDMLAAFAQVATVQDYCKPILGQTMAIKASRHPIHEKIHKTKFIANDIFASPQARFQIITGCNMSGKSTYIRSVALITVMAQVGSFVPAGYASIVIRHEIFARLSSDDSFTSNISTFAAEMREMAFILKNITPRSLVVIDELGRGTSTTDGLAIAIAIAEALIDSKALVWFVTHFGDLAKFLKERPGVLNLHLAVQLDETRMKMLYRITEGPVKEERYGIALAKVIGLPLEILSTAEEVSKQITIKKQEQHRTSLTVIRARKKKLLLALHEHLQHVKEQPPENIQHYLIDLRKEFVLRMSELDEDENQAETRSASISAHQSTAGGDSMSLQEIAVPLPSSQDYGDYTMSGAL